MVQGMRAQGDKVLDQGLEFERCSNLGFGLWKEEFVPWVGSRFLVKVLRLRA